MHTLRVWTSHMSSPIFPCCWWFRSKICGKRTWRVFAHYKVLMNWSGTKYVGLTMGWDCGKREVHLAMPGYMQKTLMWFQHPNQQKPQHKSYPCASKIWTKMTINWTRRYITATDKKDTKFIQKLTGTFLFMPKQFTAWCSQPSVPLPQIKQNQQQKF